MPFPSLLPSLSISLPPIPSSSASPSRSLFFLHFHPSPSFPCFDFLTIYIISLTRTPRTPRMRHVRTRRPSAIANLLMSSSLADSFESRLAASQSMKTSDSPRSLDSDVLHEVLRGEPTPFLDLRHPFQELLPLHLVQPLFRSSFQLLNPLRIGRGRLGVPRR